MNKEGPSVGGSEPIETTVVRPEDLILSAEERLQNNPSLIIEKIRDPNTQPDELRSLIRMFNNHDAVRRGCKGKEPIFVMMSVLQNEAWGNSNTHLTVKVQEMLDDAGIPVHSIPCFVTEGGKKVKHGTYRFTLERTRKEAIEELKKADSEFQYSPVTLFAGPKTPSPKTTAFIGTQKGEYIRALKLVQRELGVSLSSRKITDTVIEDECPIPVFLYSAPNLRSFYIRKEDSDEFVAYVKNRLKEL